MNERTKNDLKLLNDFLVCDTSYERNGEKLTVFVEGILGDVKMPVYRIVANCKKDDYDTIYALTDMAIGHLTTSLMNAIKSTEISDLKDTVNRGLAFIRENGKKSAEDKLIEEFKNKDFRADLNLVEMVFDGIKVEPDFENVKLDLYYDNGNSTQKVTSIDKDSKVVRVINSLNKVGYKASEVFLLALRNQIREFKEMYSEQLIEKKKKERERELDSNE